MVLAGREEVALAGREELPNELLRDTEGWVCLIALDRELLEG